MDLTCLFPALFFIPFLVSTATLANNSNAKPPESFAIGVRPNPSLLQKLVEEAKFNADQLISEQNLVIAQLPKWLIPKATFDTMPGAIKVIAGNDMSTHVCEYLTYKDYAAINQVSKPWRFMMKACLADDGRPLVITDPYNLVSYTKRLFNNVTEQDLDRLSVLNALMALCSRSYHPNKLLFDAALLYESQVPEVDQILNPLQRMKLFKENGLLTYFSREVARLDTEPNKELFAPAVPLLKAWQPYGTLLKLATLTPTILEEAHPKSAKIKSFIQAMSNNNYNLLEAPEICDIEPVIAYDKPCFDRSAACYAKATLGDFETLEADFRLLKRLRSFYPNHKGPNPHQGLKNCERQFCLKLVEVGLFGSENIDPRLQKRLIEMFDEITNNEYALAEMVYNQESWVRVRAFKLHYIEHIGGTLGGTIGGIRGTKTKIPSGVIITLKKILASPQFYCNAGWIHTFRDIAEYCTEVAESATNQIVKKAYYKKAAFFWSNYFNRSRCPEAAWEHHVLKEMAPTRYYLAIQAHLDAAKHCNDEKEAKAYRSQAWRLELKQIAYEARDYFGFGGYTSYRDDEPSIRIGGGAIAFGPRVEL